MISRINEDRSLVELLREIRDISWKLINGYRTLPRDECIEMMISQRCLCLEALPMLDDSARERLVNALEGEWLEVKKDWEADDATGI